MEVTLEVEVEAAGAGEGRQLAAAGTVYTPARLRERGGGRWRLLMRDMPMPGGGMSGGWVLFMVGGLWVVAGVPPSRTCRLLRRRSRCSG